MAGNRNQPVRELIPHPVGPCAIGCTQSWSSHPTRTVGQISSASYAILGSKVPASSSLPGFDVGVSLAPTGCEPQILQPFEEQVGVQRMSPRHLRHRHAGRPCLSADRALLLHAPAAVPAPTRHRSRQGSVHQSEWTPLPTSATMIDVEARSARAGRPDAHRLGRPTSPPQARNAGARSYRRAPLRAASRVKRPRSAAVASRR